MFQEVILVNEADEVIGTMEKLKAHQLGLLHRAFSVIIKNDKGEILLQQRARHKYHSGGLWTNTCSSHPNPGEETIAAAKRRLKEEMGIVCELEPKGNILYNCEFENGLLEHELDHVFVGNSNAEPIINKEEVMEYRWMTAAALKNEVRDHPEYFTYWFLELVKRDYL